MTLPALFAATSDLLDFAGLLSSETHSSLAGPAIAAPASVRSKSGPSTSAPSTSAPSTQLQEHPNSVVLTTPAHVGIAEALPLIVVLWDLPTNALAQRLLCTTLRRNAHCCSGGD